MTVRLLKVSEVADRLGYSARQVQRLIAVGRLRAVRLGEGSPWRVDEADLGRFVRSMEDNRPLRAVRRISA